MKYDYDRMNDGEISELYYSLFGKMYAIEWDDDSNHRQDEIDCIEAGVPQDMSTVGNHELPEGAIA